jgi:hypothetical protein
MITRTEYDNLSDSPNMANLANTPLPVKADGVTKMSSIIQHRLGLQATWSF